MKSKLSKILYCLSAVVLTAGIILAIVCFVLEGQGQVFQVNSYLLGIFAIIIASLLTVAFAAMGKVFKMLAQVKYNLSRATQIGLEGSVYAASPETQKKPIKVAKSKKDTQFVQGTAPANTERKIPVWVCEQCNTENSYRYGFCQKCFKARPLLKVKLKEITPKKKLSKHEINLNKAPLAESVGSGAIAAALNPEAQAVIKTSKARPNSWVCKHCGTQNGNSINYCVNCYRTK